MPAPQDEGIHRGHNPQALPLLQQPKDGRDSTGYAGPVAGYWVSYALGQVLDILYKSM